MWFHSQKLKWAFLTTFQKISPQYNYSLFPIIKVNLSPLYSWMWFQNTSDHLKLEHFYNLVSLNTYQNFSFNFFHFCFEYTLDNLVFVDIEDVITLANTICGQMLPCFMLLLLALRRSFQWRQYQFE